MKKMKITLQEKTEREVEFPSLSFYENYGSYLMVKEEGVLVVGKETIMRQDSKSDYFKKTIFDILENKFNQYVPIEESKFFSEYSATIDRLNTIVFQR